VTSGAKARHDKKAGYRSAEALRRLKSELFRNLLEPDFLFREQVFYRVSTENVPT
jgi:hypothetical protein